MSIPPDDPASQAQRHCWMQLTVWPMPRRRGAANGSASPRAHVSSVEIRRGLAGSRMSITCTIPRPPYGSSETSRMPLPTSTSSFCAFGRSSRPTRTGARGVVMSKIVTPVSEET